MTIQARVCQVIASINQDVGGPSYSVTQLAKTLSKQVSVSHLFTLDYEHHGKQVLAEGVKLHSYPATWLAIHLRGFQPDASRALHQLAATELDIVHNHGLWMFPNLYARQAATSCQIPLIISPRGMLESWSLKNSWFKKWPAWFLYERENLRQASVFHATSMEEANSIRRLGFQQPIALIPNGVNLPKLFQKPDKNILLEKHPELANKRWLLFLSRIHPKKGLDNLLYAWQALESRFQDWHLIIAGPDLIGYQMTLEKLVTALNLNSRVTFTGMLAGEPKESVLANADLFVLPTHSENFGMAIAESLAYAVPVVTTQGAPWQELETHNCGWWIEDSLQALIAVLSEGLQMSPETRQSMGVRGRQLVESQYSWKSVSQAMSSVYEWILTAGEPPICILK